MFENVPVPVSNILLGEGDGFHIVQCRLGLGRISHYMRFIGVAECTLEEMCLRTLTRIAEAHILIDQDRFLVLNAAQMTDTVSNKAAAKEIGMIKVAAPNMACQVIDWAIQAHGGAMVDEFLAHAYGSAHALRLADGPDESHRNRIGKLELSKYKPANKAH